MIIVYVILAYIALQIIRFSRDLIKRRKFVKKIKLLADEVGAKITFHQSPYKSIFKLSAKTEITFETEKAAYHIRMMTSLGFYKRILHFASPEYIVSFRRFKFVLLHASSNIAISHSFIHQDGFNYGCKVRILPKHERVAEVEGKQNIDVFLFNPTPHTVSYVTPEKTSIRMARVDAQIYGNRVFTGSTFAEHIRAVNVGAKVDIEPEIKFERRSAKKPLDEVKQESAKVEQKSILSTPLFEKPLDERAFTPPSDDDFAYAKPQAPAEEYEPFSPEKKSREIVGKVKTALIILGVLEILFIAFTVLCFTVFEKDGTLLFVAVALLIANAIAGSVVNSRIHLFMRRGKTYEATVVNRAVYTPIRRMNTLNYPAEVYHVYPKGYLKPNEKPRYGGIASITLLDDNGKRRKVYLATKNHLSLYLDGDRVKKYSGLPYPVVIGRRASVAACPACGNISAEGSEICTECACILRSDGDFPETY